MWLRDGIDGTPFFAEENGHFHFEGIQEYTTLDVEGPELRMFSQPGSSSSVTVDSGSRTSAPPPVFKSVIEQIIVLRLGSELFRLVLIQAGLASYPGYVFSLVYTVCTYVRFSPNLYFACNTKWSHSRLLTLCPCLFRFWWEYPFLPETSRETHQLNKIVSKRWVKGSQYLVISHGCFNLNHVIDAPNIFEGTGGVPSNRPSN